MYSSAELTDILSIRLSKKRFQHSLNVADEAEKLAEKYDYYSPEKAYLTGLLHDICKEIPKEEQLAMAKNPLWTCPRWSLLRRRSTMPLRERGTRKTCLTSTTTIC